MPCPASQGMFPSQRSISPFLQSHSRSPALDEGGGGSMLPGRVPEPRLRCLKVALPARQDTSPLLQSRACTDRLDEALGDRTSFLSIAPVRLSHESTSFAGMVWSSMRRFWMNWVFRHLRLIVVSSFRLDMFSGTWRPQVSNNTKWSESQLVSFQLIVTSLAFVRASL